MNLLSAKHPDRKWHEIILWWELRRIPYNVLMYLIGMLSFYIAYVTIPLVYVFIALVLNIFYTFGWLIELLFVRRQRKDIVKAKYPAISFLIILAISILFVFGFAFYILFG